MANFHSIPICSVEKRHRIFKKFFGNSGDDDIQTAGDTRIVSLICPASKKQIQIPARFQACEHLECFDLRTFLKLAMSNKAKCVVGNCSMKISARTLEKEPGKYLERDSYFMELLEKVDRSVEAVVVSKEDGTFLRPVEPKHVDVIEISDEDEPVTATPRAASAPTATGRRSQGVARSTPAATTIYGRQAKQRGDVGTPSQPQLSHNTCKFCQKKFPRSAKLTCHLRTHVWEQVKCPNCERFFCKWTLNQHVRFVHDKVRLKPASSGGGSDLNRSPEYRPPSTDDDNPQQGGDDVGDEDFTGYGYIDQEQRDSRHNTTPSSEESEYDDGVPFKSSSENVVEADPAEEAAAYARYESLMDSANNDASSRKRRHEEEELYATSSSSSSADNATMQLQSSSSLLEFHTVQLSPRSSLPAESNSSVTIVDSIPKEPSSSSKKTHNRFYIPPFRSKPPPVQAAFSPPGPLAEQARKQQNTVQVENECPAPGPSCLKMPSGLVSSAVSNRYAVNRVHFEIDEGNTLERRPRAIDQGMRQQTAVTTKKYTYKKSSGLDAAARKFEDYSKDELDTLRAKTETDVANCLAAVKEREEEVRNQPQGVQDRERPITRWLIGDSLLHGLRDNIFKNVHFTRYEFPRSPSDFVDNGLVPNMRNILRDLNNFEFSYVFVAFGYDVLAKFNANHAKVEYLGDIHSWFREYLANTIVFRRRGRHGREVDVELWHRYRIPTIVLVTIPEYPATIEPELISNYNKALRAFVESKNEQFPSSFALLDWAQLVAESPHEAHNSGEKRAKLLVDAMREQFGVFVR